MSPPAVSRKLAKLEEELECALFERDKRPLRMTEEAKGIFAFARKMIDEKKKISEFCKAKKAAVTNVLRVMIGNAHYRFAPELMHQYSQMHPDLKLTIISPAYLEDFMRGKADVICLSGQQPYSPPNCVFISRGKRVFIPVASPEYLKKHGPITHPDQLVNHRIFSNLYPGRFSFEITYPLTKKGLTQTIVGIENIRYSNVFMSYQAVLRGEGIGLSMPVCLCIDDLEAGNLVPVLNGWHRPSQESHVVVKKEDWDNPTIRLFAVWWAKKLAEHQKECEKRLVKLYDRQFLANLKT